MEYKFIENDPLNDGVKVEEGLCPYCGSSHLDFTDWEEDGLSLQYSVRCNSCHKDFLMHYALTFTGVSVEANTNE